MCPGQSCGWLGFEGGNGEGFMSVKVLTKMEVCVCVCEREMNNESVPYLSSMVKLSSA